MEIYEYLENAAILKEIDMELVRAREKFKPINSAHEGYAVILEEVEEFWQQVMLKKSLRDPEAMRKELIQIAAMAIRTLQDVIDTGTDPQV